jgi:hypothetical protein
VPSREVVIVRVLLGLLDGVQQFFLVVFVDELAGLLALVRDQPGVSPLLGHGPNFDAFGFG